MADPEDNPALEIEPAGTSFDDDAENGERASSRGSGSLTQRAALIRDELLGNDSLGPHSEHESISSSGASADSPDDSGPKDESRDDSGDLEDRLNNSAIAHSLRHIAMAFDEKSRELESLRKIQKTHKEETALLRAQIEYEKEETQTLTKELNQLKSSHAALSCELEALRRDLENKEELLCVSDRISSRLFDMIHAIKAQIEAAESLSPAMRSISTSSSFSTASLESDSISVTSSEGSITPTNLIASPTTIEALIKQIEAKYSE
ncbi:uncharacterized protein SPSC_00484 [Sporisorium scitamineum]|uniref:Uncharacterized protein n=1 Tax=Sporisorium scitamineum TaxID=49012 RepID=A0A0F7S4B6_9BASI|nr:uncharacterized protein SPSC_00484 [Sporisorium scitamineum]CDW94042.1 hypothetical protein [Sporisorium scitamineum]